MKRILIIVLYVLINLVNCEKPDSDEFSIKQLKIDFYAGGVSKGTSNSKGVTFESTILYKNFNINNYQGCDTVMFIASLASSNRYNNCYLELYNFTDSTFIENSTLITSSINDTMIESQNLINSFLKRILI